MKKMSIYLIIVVALFGLIFVLNQSDKNALYGKPSSQLNPATKALLNDPNYQNIILPDELNTRVKSAEGSFIYFFASDCIHCRNTTPVLMPIVKDLGIDLPQFNLREFQEYFNKYDIEFTPTLAYYKDGKLVEKLEGGVSEGGGPGYSKDDFISFFKRHSGKEG